MTFLQSLYGTVKQRYKPHTYNGSIWVQAYTVIDGGNIETGSISAAKLDISNLADIANLQLGSTGYIRTAGKESFADTTPGFWLGYDGAYKFSLGDSANYIKWNGSALNIKGTLDVSSLSAITATLGSVSSGIIDGVKIKVGNSSGSSIYFKYSGVYFLDKGSRSLELQKSGYKTLQLTLDTSGAGIACTNGDTNIMASSGYRVGISPGSSYQWIFDDDGVMHWDRRSSAPTGYRGAMCWDLAEFRSYDYGDSCWLLFQYRDCGW